MATRLPEPTTGARSCRARPAVLACVAAVVAAVQGAALGALLAVVAAGLLVADARRRGHVSLTGHELDRLREAELALVPRHRHPRGRPRAGRARHRPARRPQRRRPHRGHRRHGPGVRRTDRHRGRVRLRVPHAAARRRRPALRLDRRLGAGRRSRLRGPRRAHPRRARRAGLHHAAPAVAARPRSAPSGAPSPTSSARPPTASSRWAPTCGCGPGTRRWRPSPASRPTSPSASTSTSRSAPPARTASPLTAVGRPGPVRATGAGGRAAHRVRRRGALAHLLVRAAVRRRLRGRRQGRDRPQEAPGRQGRLDRPGVATSCARRSRPSRASCTPWPGATPSSPPRTAPDLRDHAPRGAAPRGARRLAPAARPSSTRAAWWCTAPRWRGAIGSGAGRSSSAARTPPAPSSSTSSRGAGTVLADESLAVGVLTNLLSNALKYAGGDGPIEVVVEADGDEVITSVDRPRPRHPPLGPDPDLRQVHPARQPPDPLPAGRGPRPAHRQAVDRAPRRPDLGGRDAGGRRHVPLHAAAGRAGPAAGAARELRGSPRTRS